MASNTFSVMVDRLGEVIKAQAIQLAAVNAELLITREALEAAQAAGGQSNTAPAAAPQAPTGAVAEPFPVPPPAVDLTARAAPIETPVFHPEI